MPVSDEDRDRSVLANVIGGLLMLSSVAVFVFSLTRDGFYIDRPENPRAWAPCIALLLVGWITVIDGVFAWLANPLLVASWLLILCKDLRFVSLGSAIGALMFALSFLLHDEIMTDEGGGHSKITGYGDGYWIWIGSIGASIIANTFLCIFTRPDEIEQQTESVLIGSRLPAVECESPP